MTYAIHTEFDEPPIHSDVGDAKTSGRVYVPKDWRGHKVVVALIPEQKEVSKSE